MLAENYLKLDSSNAMTGADLKFLHDVMIRSYATNYIGLLNKAATIWRGIRVGYIFSPSIRNILATQKMELQRGGGGGPTTVAYVSDAADEFVIPRAGDITSLSQKYTDLRLGDFLLPTVEPVPRITAAGLCYYWAATNTLYIFDGTNWQAH